MKFSIISPGWGCARFIPDWYRSLVSQKVDWEAWVMDDCSPDNTGQVIDDLDDSRIHFSKTPRNRGAAYCRWMLLRKCDPDSILVFLDLDDWLTDNCLKKLRAPYRNGKLVTLGNYTTNSGSGARAMQVYSQIQIDTNSFIHQSQFKCPPLRTFHGSLLPKISQTDFRINGRWLQTCTDVALFWKILWSVRYSDIQIIRDIMYVYRKRGRMLSSNRFDKKQALQQLREKYRKKKHL